MKLGSLKTPALLILIFAVLSFGASLFQAPTYDEPAGLAAGLSYWTTGKYRLYLEDPPLVKLAAALPLYLLNIPLPESPKDWEAARAFPFGEKLLYQNTHSPDFILGLGRAGVLALNLLLPLCLYLFTQSLAGKRAAMAAVFAILFLPPILGHAPLIKTDVPFAGAFMGALFSLRSLMERGKGSSALLAGGILGLAMATKFSAILLLPILAGILILERARFMRWAGKRAAKISALYLLAALGVLMILCMFQPGAWIKGLRFILQDALSGRDSFLWGENRKTGWLLYFPLAFLWKTPLPHLAAIAVSLFLLAEDKLTVSKREIFVWVIFPLAAFLVMASFSKTHIGLRHIFPVYPLFALLIGVAFGSLSASWMKRGFAILGLWAMIETAVSFPHYIAYFNLLVGGSSQGHRYLVDSNLDWGQSLKGLGDWMRKNGVGGIYLSYFGNADPHAYGIRYVKLPGMGEVSREGDGINLRKERRVYLAISATHLRHTFSVDKTLWRWMNPMTPVDAIGHSILIYDITKDPQAHRQLSQIFKMMENPGQAKAEEIWAEDLERLRGR